MVNNLLEELNCNNVFTIPIFGGIPIAESVAVTWIIMAVLLIVSILLTRNLKVRNPGKVQIALESIVSMLYDFFDGILGKNGTRYIPYLLTVITYLAVSNLIGILGFKPPTKDLGVTATLALMSIVLIEYAGIHQKGVKGWLKSFTEPVVIITPMNILEVLIRPLALCMRLFGNVLGAFVIMELIKQVVPVIAPAICSCYFDLFDGLIQAYVFTFLTSMFMKEELE
ncbi:MAG: F0F1 ATP synthase subunit A [Lachnospiraceae bacterium]